jgi:LysM repeat protein
MVEKKEKHEKVEKVKSKKRRRTRKGGQKISPGSIVVPQAPTMGGMKVTPNSGNHLSKIASQILVNSKEQAKYDNMVGGKRKRKQSLKSKLERMLRF